MTGEKGGSQARLLLQATGIAGVYDFLATTFHVWHEFVDFQFIPLFKTLADRAKVMRLLEPSRIGVELSEEMQLHPEQSTDAIVLHHPEAKYFSV